MLRLRGWFVRETHGNAFQKGWPDVYAHNNSFKNSEFGPVRWIDCKVKGSYQFTKAQCQEWPRWEAGGVGIWIMTGAEEEDYKLLFENPNWRKFWKPAYDKYVRDINEILGEMDEETS